MTDQPRNRRRILARINQLLIVIAVAGLLWGILLSQWRVVLIQARFL